MPSRDARPPPLAAGLLDSLQQYLRLMRLDRPIGIWLLLWPALWGLWVAAEGRPQPRIFAVMVLGVVVMRSAGCVINDYADRDFDPRVARTRDRPLASGRVSPAEALVLFTALSLLAIALALMLDPLARVLAVVGGLLTIVYPFMKRVIAAPQLVLGAAFGWSIPMAFAAETGAVPRLAWLMWLAVVVWALIYDTMYAMADRADDLRVGVKSTAILFGSADVFIVSLLMIVLLLGLALVGHLAALGPWYFGSLPAAAALLLRQRHLIAGRDPARCFQAFLESHLVGAAVFAGILLDFTFRQA
ncbi:MAG: 4-hydroxybenzoate octaprenyltransferase [Gammaproteobacteria bacterium]|nr:MAG: 4-hydroxybenzoate octaprenyltransferase [Gammaproteobacteria bacterium]